MKNLIRIIVFGLLIVVGLSAPVFGASQKDTKIKEQKESIKSGLKQIQQQLDQLESDKKK